LVRNIFTSYDFQNIIYLTLVIHFFTYINHIGDAKCNITTTVSAKKVFAIKNPEDSVLTDYIRFVVKYTSMIFGKRKILSEFKKNKNCTLFDVLTPSDEAFAIVIFENNQDKWEGQAKKIMKMDEEEADSVSFDKENEDQSKSPIKKAKWSGVRSGKKNAYLQDNWSEDGKKRYIELGKIIQTCRNLEGDVHKAHVEAWNIYNKKYKFVPVPKSAEVDPDTDIESATTSAISSLGDVMVPKITMVNGKFDFTNVFGCSV